MIRKPIEKKSSCAESSTQLLSSIENRDISTRSRTPGCGFGGRYERAVIIITNGLVFDFDETLVKEETLNRDSISKLINDFNAKNGKHSKVYKLSQTVSLSSTQKFQSLITGGLQTFLQLNTNFKPFELIEDNLVYQLRSKSKRVTLLANSDLNGSYVADWFDQSIHFGPHV